MNTLLRSTEITIAKKGRKKSRYKNAQTEPVLFAARNFPKFGARRSSARNSKKFSPVRAPPERNTRLLEGKINNLFSIVGYKQKSGKQVQLHGVFTNALRRHTDITVNEIEVSFAGERKGADRVRAGMELSSRFWERF